MPTATPEVLQGRAVARRERKVGVEYQLDVGFVSFADLASLTLAELDNTAPGHSKESLASGGASAESLVSASGAAAESIVSSSTASRETLVG